MILLNKSCLLQKCEGKVCFFIIKTVYLYFVKPVRKT